MVLTVPLFYIFFKKSGYLINYRANIWNIHVKKYLSLITPILFGMFLMRVIKISDTFLASFLKDSAIAHLSYSLRLTSNFDKLFSAFYIIYFPLLAKLNNDKNKEHAEVFFNGFEVLFLVSFSLAIFLSYFANDIIKLLFERGAFTGNDTAVVANILRAYTVMLIASPLGSYFANTYFGRQHNKRAIKYSIISSISNIILNFIFVQFWGVYGIAFASSIAYLIGNLLQSFNLSKVNNKIKFSKIIHESLIIIALITPALILTVYVTSFFHFQISLKLYIFIKLTINLILYIFFIISSLIVFKHDIGTKIKRKIKWH